jgi:hypothetical protein
MLCGCEVFCGNNFDLGLIIDFMELMSGDHNKFETKELSAYNQALRTARNKNWLSYLVDALNSSFTALPEILVAQLFFVIQNST